MAATANELLRDALLRRQMALSRLERGLQTDVIDLLDATERDLRNALQDRLDQLIGREFGPTTNSRLNVLENAIRKIRSEAFDQTGEMWDQVLAELAKDEADYINTHFKDVSPVQLDTVLPDPTQLAAIVSVNPVQGRLLSEWTSDMEDADVQRIMDAVKIGMAQGDTSDDIVRRVLGTTALDGADGIVNMSRTSLAAITQTAVSTIANEARAQYYAANSDIIQEVQWVATLDADTCPECGDLDGQTWPVGEEEEQPPAHINCRCVMVPVLDGDALGDRPSVAATADDLEGLDDEERAATIGRLVGQVPATTSYSDWLANQTDAFQDHALGPSRAALFRDGELPLSRFMNSNGDTYNLEQLRAREPEAFRRAGM